MRLNLKDHSLFEKTLFLQSFWFIIICIIWIFSLFSHLPSPDYTSGELYDHFLAWFENGTLYTSINQSPYRVLNYPPLFFLFTLGIHKLGFSILSSGKLASLLFFIFGIWISLRWMKEFNFSNKTSFGIIALLGTSFPVFYNLGQWSIQWPAVVLSLVGLYCIQKGINEFPSPLRGEGQGEGDNGFKDHPPSNSLPSREGGFKKEKKIKIYVFLGGFFCGLACFVKQTQILAALIGFLWLFRYHRIKSLWFLLSLFFTGAVGSIFLQFYFGDEVWRHIFTYTIGTFSFLGLLKQLALHLLPWIIFFSFGVWLGFKEKESRRDLRWWYFIGTSFSLLSSARIGAGHQYFLEWTAATLLWIGPSIVYKLKQMDREKLSAVRCPLSALSFLLLFQIIAADLGVGAILLSHLKKLKATEKALPEICSSLGESKVIPSENPGLIRTCGKTPALQPFIMANLAEKKLWDQEFFLQKLRKGDYPILLLPFDLEKEIRGAHAERWTPEMLQAMRENYRIEKEINEWRFYQWKKD